MQGPGAYGASGAMPAPPQPPMFPPGMTGAAGQQQQQAPPGFSVPPVFKDGAAPGSAGVQYLNQGGTKTYTADDGEEVKILPLGSGGEVGRSCIVCSYGKRNIMFDCGVHPAKQGLDALPLFDHVAMETIDVLLITHFHLDHCAALPYLLAQTNFKGKVYMTSATKAFYKYVLADFARIGSVSDIITPDWIEASMDVIETVEYHQEKAWNGIRFQALNAGHVLGAAMFQVDMAGVKILYTGDYSSVPDRHLMGAEIPPEGFSPDILIVESTYGIQVHETREEREEKFLRWVTDIVSQGGRCLIPVFALGRAQELLLILEEHWREHEELQHVKILYASSLAQRCMKLYQRYVHSMNDRVKRQQELTSTNPFDFKFVQPLANLGNFQDSGPAVVIAAPGMLQNGVSLELFERWCGDRRNGIIFAGYCVEGTLAKDVMSKPKQVTTTDGRVLNLKMSTIQTVSFSAHSDARQTSDFISKLSKVSHVVLVHGNEDASGKLAAKLTEDFKPTRDMTVYKTKNLDMVKIKFNTQRTAKVLGSLATLTTRPKQHSAPATAGGADEDDGEEDGLPQREVPEGQYVSGILLISKDHNHIIVHPDEVTTFTGLQHSTVTQALVLPLPMHKSTADVLDWLKLYFADSASYNSFGVAKQQNPATAGGGGENQTVSLMTSATEDGEDVLLVGAGLGGPAAGGGGVIEAGAGAPRGVLVKLRTDPNTAHTTATIVWRTSRLTDLIADVTSIALCRLVTEHNAMPDEDEDEEDEPEKTGAARSGNQTTVKTNAKGIEDKVTLPVEVAAQGIDPYFKAKCFHQMLSQFFPNVRTNLLNGDCHITCSNGEKVFVKNFCEIFAEDELGGSPNGGAAGTTATEREGYINGVTTVNFNAVAQILKRVYLTLFPVPADFGWCECGQQHGDSHLVHEQEAEFLENEGKHPSAE